MSRPRPHMPRTGFHGLGWQRALYVALVSLRLASLGPSLRIGTEVRNCWGLRLQSYETRDTWISTFQSGGLGM